MPTFKVTNVQADPDSPPVTRSITADRFEADETTGVIRFINGVAPNETLVARLVNVNVEPGE